MEVSAGKIEAMDMSRDKTGDEKASVNEGVGRETG